MCFLPVDISIFIVADEADVVVGCPQQLTRLQRLLDERIQAEMTMSTTVLFSLHCCFLRLRLTLALPIG